MAGKAVVTELDPLETTFARFLFAAVAMLPCLAWLHPGRLQGFRTAALWRHLAIVVLLGGIGYHALFFWALALISPTEAAIIVAFNPFFTALGDVVFLRARKPPRFYAGFALAFAGALFVLVARGGALDLAHLGLGHAIALASALAWSTYTLLARATKSEAWDSLWINAIGFAFTAALLVPVLGPRELIRAFAHMSATAWMGALYMGLFPTALGYTLYYVAVQKRGPSWASSYVYLVPSLAAAFDAALFGAPITLPMVAGTALVVCGLAWGNVSTRALRAILR